MKKLQMKSPQKVMLSLAAALALLSASCGNPWLREALNKSDDSPAVQSTPTPEVPNALILQIKAGSDKTFTIPTNNSWAHDWYIDWGDGTPEEHFADTTDTGISHTFPTKGIYNIKIRADGDTGHAAFGFGYGTSGANNPANKRKLLKALGHIKENTSAPEFPNAWAYCFYNCINLTEVSPTLLPAVPNGTSNIFSYMFYGCDRLESLPAGFTLPAVPEGTSNIFSNMFYGCSSLESLPDKFTLPDVPEGTSYIFAYMFYGCIRLESLPAGFKPPADLPEGTSGIFVNMFIGCSSLERLPDGFKLPTVPEGTNGIFQGMFANCTRLESLPDGFTLPAVPKGTNFIFSHMFRNCSSLDVSIEDLITDLIMDEGQLNNMYTMSETFYNCFNLTGSAQAAISAGFPGTTLTSDRDTFSGCTTLDDYDDIDENWK
jgi:hypothetical protein